MKKLYLVFISVFLTALSFGQAVEIANEGFGTGGFWEGPMNTNPNLTSPLEFSDHKARTQGWNASKNYDKASGGFHVILTNGAATDTVKFSLNTLGFDDLTFSIGAFSWGASKDQMEFTWSTDGVTYTVFDESSLVTGDMFAGGWQFLTFSEVLPSVEEFHIKFYRTADQVHFDDIIITGVPNNTNAFLQTLEISEGNLPFRYYNSDYTVDLPFGTTATPTVTATAFNSSAAVNVTDAADVTSATDADRTTTIEVTAEDGTTVYTYNILFNVLPPRTNANLNSIELQYSTLAPDFSSDHMDYLVDLPDTATITPTVTPVLADPEGATVVVTPAADIRSADRADRTTTIEVTAQDGVTVKTYTVLFQVGGQSSDLFLWDVETFGDEGNKFGINLAEYPGFTSDFIPGDQTVNIRTSNPSTGYDLASGANRLEVQAGWGNGFDTAVFQVNTSQIGNVTLAFGIYNNSGADVGAGVAFRGYFSIDSINWTSMGNETQGGTAFPVKNTWSYVILDDVLPTDDTLYIMFANEDPNFEYYLDDISIWGTPLNTNSLLSSLVVSEGTLEPAFDPATTSYTVALPQGSSVTPTITANAQALSAELDIADATNIRSVDDADATTTITVTAENGNVTTYEVLFDVFMSEDATLAELSVEEYALSPNFSNDIAGYGVKLPAGLTSAPDITAVANDDFAVVDISGPADITSSDVADRTAVITVTAEDMVTMKTFEVVFTFGSLQDVRFNIMQEAFSTTGTFEAEAYAGYTSDAMFDGDEHKWDNQTAGAYPNASGGAAIKFGEWEATPTYVELVMKKMIQGYTNIRFATAIKHNSNGWGDGGCGLTNNFIGVEYTTDSLTWMPMNVDSLSEGSSPWPCGGADYSFVELGEIIPLSEDGYVTIRITHTDGKIHPFYLDDLVFTGSPISTDATLFDLTSSEGDLDPLFDPFIDSYTVELPIGTTATPTVTATASEDGADVVVTDATDVTSEEEADRTTTVVVTAPDGLTSKTYTIVFNVKPNNDATLSGISLSQGTLDPDFNLAVFDYDVELDPGTTATPTVTATPSDANANVDVTDATDVRSETAADRTTTIVVTAEDGSTQLTYSIEFTVSTVSVGTMTAEHFGLYPNPAEDILNLRNSGDIASLKVTDLSGKVYILQDNNHGIERQLDISGLESGVYVISITTIHDSVVTASFMKK